ncbi:MAG: hypothetical protein ACE5FJ_08240 [Gemmatimonadales bacterium]
MKTFILAGLAALVVAFIAAEVADRLGAGGWTALVMVVVGIATFAVASRLLSKTKKDFYQ